VLWMADVFWRFGSTDFLLLSARLAINYYTFQEHRAGAAIIATATIMLA